MAAAVALAEFQKLVAMDIVAAEAEHYHLNLAVVLVQDLADYYNQQLYSMAELVVVMLLYELMLQLSVVELMAAAEIVVAAEYCAVVDIVLLPQHDNYLSQVFVHNYSDLDLDYYHNQVDRPLLVVDHTSVAAVIAELENMELVELVVQLVEHVVMHLNMEPVVLVVRGVHGIQGDHEVQQHVVVQLVHVLMDVVVQQYVVHVDQHREVQVREDRVHVEVLVDVEQH